MIYRTILFIFILFSANVKPNNPIIKGQGVCDGHIHIFGNTAYLFSTHDTIRNGKEWHMKDWQLFSSPDLINWKKEYILKPEDTYVGPFTKCFATDGAERNGQYYFYFSKGGQSTGVAVANNPNGPYKDALGSKLVTSYDPTIYIDDDVNKTPYLIWGAIKFYIAKLKEDMVSLAEEPHPLEMNNWPKIHDGSYLHKKNGMYYLTSQGASYGISKDIYGPYTYVATLHPYNRGEWVDHPTFFSWNNQDFFVGNDSEFGGCYRFINLTYVAYKDDGSISTDVFIYSSGLGVGQYDAQWKKIEAEWYFAASKNVIKKECVGGFELQNITDGTYLYFPKIKNIGNNSKIDFLLSSVNNNKNTVIEVHSNSFSGKLLGKCKVPDTNSWSTYKHVTCTLNKTSDEMNLYFVFKGKGADLLHLDSFEFKK